MRNFFIKLAKITLGILGFVAVDSCNGISEVKAEYGCPHSDFEVKGRVKDEAGNGIPGIKVVVSAKKTNSGIVETSLNKTLWTDQNGEYVNSGDDLYIVGNLENIRTVKIEFEDADGPENGGEFQNTEVEVPVIKVKDGDGNWYDGAYRTEADVTMQKK